jgi:mycothiol S-conjugate amidase
MKALHDKFLELGLESPFTGERLKSILEADSAPAPGSEGDLPRVVVDVTGYTSVTREALLAHATQVDPNSRMWFGLPPDAADSVYPYEEYEVARDLTAAGPSADGLFDGVETVVAGVGTGSSRHG